MVPQTRRVAREFRELPPAEVVELLRSPWHEERLCALLLLVRSKRLWERRIAILATAHFIDRSDFGDTLALSELLLADEHDLMHKAVGWMLREVGKRDARVLEDFLETHRARMPRTALRCAIERFPDAKRRRFLRRSRGRGLPARSSSC